MRVVFVNNSKNQKDKRSQFSFLLAATKVVESEVKEHKK